MPKRSGIMIYFENWKPIMQLPDGEIAKLLRAALDYGETGHEPTDIKANVYFNALWIQIRETIKRDEARYDETCRKNRYNVYKREEKRYNREPLEYDVWCEEIDRYHSISNDNQPITTDNDTNQTQTESQETNENSNEQTKADKPPRAARADRPETEKTGLEKALDDFAAARKAMKKPLTDKAKELTLRELEKLAPGDEAQQIAIINQSIQRGWQGVFPLKDDEPAQQRKTKGPPLKTPYDDLPPKSTTGDDLERLAKMFGVET